MAQIYSKSFNLHKIFLLNNIDFNLEIKKKKPYRV